MSSRTSLTNRFRQLRWKLTLTYTGVTVGALLTVELALLGAFGIGLVVLLNSGVLPAQLIEAASVGYAPFLRFYLDQEPPDQEGIADWLEYVGDIYSETIPLTFDATDEMLVVGSDGRLLGERPPGLLGNGLIGRPLDPRAIPALEEPLQAALAGEDDLEKLYAFTGAGDKVIMTMPIWDTAHDRVLGVLVAIGEVPTVMTLLGDIVPILVVSLLFFTFVAGLAGTVYGFLAARGPVYRLDRLSEASLAWSQGDFSVFVDDPSLDEFGQLANRLNNMAQQLQRLIAERRELVVVEERNRLARDLHDSAKQLAFAAAAQINAARTLLKQNPGAAQVHIEEAERLTRDLRRELANLIQQLRPVALEDKGLASAVREYAADWSRQNGISVEVRVQRERSLAQEDDTIGYIEQAVFRIVQEALANVARHSQASSVEIRLVYTELTITCTIRDDGIGFDPDKGHRGFGLRSMGERADALGGNLIIESLLGKGTTISFTVPLNGSTGYGEEEAGEQTDHSVTRR